MRGEVMQLTKGDRNGEELGQDGRVVGGNLVTLWRPVHGITPFLWILYGLYLVTQPILLVHPLQGCQDCTTCSIIVVFVDG